MSWRTFALLLLVSMAWPDSAFARVQRFAVLIGNNRGESHETPLRYATSDAARLYRVLRELGGFEPVDMVLLRDEDTATVRSTLLSINERIREAVSQPDTDVLLLVYYSGHADAEQLHLGDTHFAVRELAQLVGGSAATFRLLVLDACRSGSLTRVKGGKVVDPFDLPNARLPGHGLAFLTAASADEHAQESDELKASFFSHALVSGLLGAADRDGDGAVALDEAYRYAYETTLRSTSRTLAGTQHPNFRYDFRGSGGLVLTRPESRAAERTRLLFPAGMGFLLMREHAEGPVAAELSSVAPQRSLSVRPGQYFVRARGRDVLYEGRIQARAGESFQVDVDDMQRIEYARLVRKGQRHSRIAHGPELGARFRSPLPNETRACFGGFVGYAIDFEQLGARVRVSGCSSGFDNAIVSATCTAFDLGLRVYRAWDLPVVSLDLGLGGGLSLLTQSFSTAGHAPSRQSTAPFLSVSAGAGVELGAGFGLGLAVAAETHFVALERSVDEGASTSVAFAVRPALSLAKRF